MSEKGGTKKTNKSNKEARNTKKPITVRLNDGTTVNASTIYEEGTTIFGINDLDISKIKVSDKKHYSKGHDSYKHYVFYEHNNKHIPLKMFVLNVTGRYHSFNDGSKTMSFILNSALLEKIDEIFSDIEAKLGFEINDFTYNKGHSQCFKTKVTDKTCLRLYIDIEENILPRQGTDYNCRVLVKIESAFFNNRNNKDNINSRLLNSRSIADYLLIILNFQIMSRSQSQTQRVNLKKSLMKIMYNDLKELYFDNKKPNNVFQLCIIRLLFM